MHSSGVVPLGLPLYGYVRLLAEGLVDWQPLQMYHEHSLSLRTSQGMSVCSPQDWLPASSISASSGLVIDKATLLTLSVNACVWRSVAWIAAAGRVHTVFQDSCA